MRCLLFLVCFFGIPHSTLYTLHTLHSPLNTLHSTLLTLHSTLQTPHCTLSTAHSTLYTFHSTLPTGNRGNVRKTVQLNYCRKVFCVTAYPCVSISLPLTYVWAFGFVGRIFFQYKRRWYPQQPQPFIFTSLSEAYCETKRWKPLEPVGTWPGPAPKIPPKTFSGTFPATSPGPVEPDLALHQGFLIKSFSETFSATLLNLTWRLPDLLRNLLRNPIEPDLALHQSLPEPSPEPSPEPCWT